MGRLLAIPLLASAVITLTAAMALRAAEATLAVAAVAVVAILLTWYAQLHSGEEQSGADLASPAAAVTLAVVGRRPWSTLLPVIAAHVIGGVLGGLLALSLEDRLGDTLIFPNPSLTLAAVGAALVGLVGAWATLSIDAGGSEGLAAVPAVVAGAVLPLGLVVAFQPAALIGLATAGLVPWDVTLVAAASTVIASVVGAYAVSLLVPTE